jgi:hypothetical protein
MYILMSCHQNAGQTDNIKKVANATKFKYLGMTVANQTLTREDINGRLNSRNACYHSVQNLLSSSLLLKKVKN